MLSTSNNVARKFCVIFLVTLLTAMSFLPAFAEDEKKTLSEDNIVTYPKIEGTVPYTQKIGDYLTIKGGKVTTDGTENGTIVTGYWEFIDPDYIPTGIGAILAEVRFVPDESDIYDPLEINRNFNMFYDVTLAPMEFADSSTEFVLTAGSVGARLGTIKLENIDWLKDILFKCPLTGDIIEATPQWTWDLAKSTQINESGYYPATVSIAKYTPITVYFYIKVPGDDSKPPFSMFPTIKPVTYHDGLKAGELEIVTEEDVEGTFEIVNPDQELKAGDNSVAIKFKPQDDSQSEVTLTLCAVVEKANASFIDENGDITVPELPLTQGTCTLGTIRSMLEAKKANVGTFKIGDIHIEGIELRHQLNNCDFTLENKAEGYAATAQLKSQENNNYTNTVQFKIVIVKKIVTPRISTFYFSTDEQLIIDGVDYPDNLGIKGTFKVYANGELIESTENGVTYLTGFKWRPAKSGTYKLKAEYTPADDDICAITGNVIENEVTVALKWTVKGENVNFESTTAQYGSNVTVLQSLGDNFNGWEFYDENGNKYADPEKELNMRYDPTVPSTVNFTMPDHDVTVKALDKTQNNGGNSSDFFANIVKWLNCLAAKLQALFNAIVQLLSAVR